jgi:flagellar protein FliJ
MKKFAFQLQSLYDVKLTLEEQQKNQLKQVEARLAKLNEEMEVLQYSFAKTREEYRIETETGIQAEKLSWYGGYFDLLNKSMTLQREKIAQAEAQREKCLETLLEIRKEVKSLEKLKDKQYEEYLKEVKNEEEKAIGDMISYKVAAS